MSARNRPRWLLLIHQIPPRPNYLRVKIGRHLRALGALPVKNSVYVLPNGEQALEDFQWVRREILAGRGDASVCEVHFVEGLSDQGVEALFHAALEAEYATLLREARRLHAGLRPRSRRTTARARARAATVLLRLRKRLAEVVAVDFFGTPGRVPVEGLLAAVERHLRQAPASTGASAALTADAVRGRTWVTRSGVHVDRIASAWLIRRFIDPEAGFKFVHAQEYEPRPGEVRFDMFQAEFTHEGERCTFEVLLQRFALHDRALSPIAQIVHDIDLKDAKFGRPETLGVDHLIAGIALRHSQDEPRLQDGNSVFEALYEYFKAKR